MKFRSVLTISIFLVIHANPAISQINEYLKIKTVPWEGKSIGVIKFTAHSQTQVIHIDSPIVLSNRDTITRYFYQQYFLTSTKDSQKNYISVLVGTDSKFTPLLVVDNNFDHSFSNDSVYKYSPFRSFRSNREFYDSLPEIPIANLRIPSFSRTDTLWLRLAPYMEGTKFLNDEKVIKGEKKYALSFYVSNYLEAEFNVNNQQFRLAIIPHPLSFPVYKLPNNAQSKSKWSYIIYTLPKNGVGKYLHMGVYQDLVDHLKDTLKAFKVLNKYLLFNSISLDSNLINVSLIDSAVFTRATRISQTKYVTFPSIRAYSVSEKDSIDFKFNESKLTLVEFSGSWCAPCAEILPYIQLLHKKYANKMNFVTLMEEKSKEDAENYYIQHPLPWRVFFENIDDSNSVRSKLGIHIYPTFFLVNQFGEIIYRHSTSKEFETIETKIEQTINNGTERQYEDFFYRERQKLPW